MALQQELYYIPVEISLPRVRKDSLPEGSIYRDEGCSIASECLKCPLPQCRYDGGQLYAYRDHQIREMRAIGFRIGYLAQHFEVSVRTVSRAIHGREATK